MDYKRKRERKRHDMDPRGEERRREEKKKRSLRREKVKCLLHVKRRHSNREEWEKERTNERKKGE